MTENKALKSQYRAEYLRPSSYRSFRSDANIILLFGASSAYDSRGTIPHRTFDAKADEKKKIEPKADKNKEFEPKVFESEEDCCYYFEDQEEIEEEPDDKKPPASCSDNPYRSRVSTYTDNIGRVGEAIKISHKLPAKNKVCDEYNCRFHDPMERVAEPIDISHIRLPARNKVCDEYNCRFHDF